MPRSRRGRDPGPLAGVPFAVKNLFDIEGVVTLRRLEDQPRDTRRPRADATLVTRLKAAGAVLLGALNMGEYAYDFTGENAHDGPSRNPHAPDAHVGRLVRRLRRRPWRRAWCRWRSAPTPMARSACPPRSAASSG